MFFPYSPFYYNNYYRHFYPKYYNKANTQSVPNTNLVNQNLNQKKVQQDIKQESKNKDYKITENQKRSAKYNSFAKLNPSALFDFNLYTPVIEILGIKLYLDDLIIIGLLFFLYKEEVHDEILFSILLLLLLN